MIKIYDSLTETKKILKKPRRGYIKMFVCGPTVYDYSHIGHARTFLIYDIFARYLRSQGYPLFYLQNITDVDDKIINRAKEEKKSPFELANFFYRDYLNDMKSLGIKSVNKYALASKFIPQIVKQIQTLIKKGHAYKIENDGWYFDISTFPEYGKLSKRTAVQAEDAVSRIDESVKKRNRGDFALWKISNGEPVWDTPLGLGRPGWHIEDTAITEKYFGPQYDIHGGAVELKFPHHEAEIAQQESASGKKPFVKIWMHSGILLVNGQKMSKSLGNFITIRQFLNRSDRTDKSDKSYRTNPSTALGASRSNILRMIVLSHHYRSPMDYSEGMALQAEKSLKTVGEFLAKIKLTDTKILGYLNTKILRYINETKREIEKALSDDFNTPQALAAIFGFINKINRTDWSNPSTTLGASRSNRSIKEFITTTFKIFGIEIKPIKIPVKIKKLVDEREHLRKNQQFIPADLLRKKIEALGYGIEDTPAGPLVLTK